MEILCCWLHRAWSLATVSSHWGPQDGVANLLFVLHCLPDAGVDSFARSLVH